MYSITCPLNELHFDVAHVLSVKWPLFLCCTCAVARLKLDMPNMLQTLFGRITGPKHAILIRIFIRKAKPDYIELTFILISHFVIKKNFLNYLNFNNGVMVALVYILQLIPDNKRRPDTFILLNRFVLRAVLI